MDAVEVPYNKLEKTTLIKVIEEFVSREGTDYGHQEVSLDDKVRDVTQQLASGRAKLMFDPETNTCTIIKTYN